MNYLNFTVKRTFLTAVIVEFVTFNTCWDSTYPVFRVNVILQLTLNCKQVKLPLVCWQKITVNCLTRQHPPHYQPHLKISRYLYNIQITMNT